MRLMVDGGSYLAAATAFRAGNQLAALQHDALAGRLAAYGGMAGNDATSIDFARSYDAAATTAVAALADLSAAFVGLGRLTQASEANHRRADEAATAQLAGPAPVGGDTQRDDYVRVSPAAPPSSLDAQEPGLGPVETWILDQVEGFVWPGADTDRLQAAATTWRRAAEGVTDLLDHCDRGASGLAAQRSPEVPVALDAVAELRALIRGTADQLATVAGSCEEYAAHVEEARARTRALLAEVAQMVVEGMVVSAAVGLITGGTATGAVAGATLARVAAQAPRFRAVLEALRASAGAVAARLRGAQEGALAVRARLEKFLHLELRNERGALGLPGAGRARGRLQSPIDLRAHDAMGGHGFARHVGKTESYLEQRIQDGMVRASTFRNEVEADEAVSELVRRNGAAIQNWLDGGGHQLVVRGDLGRVTGISMDHAGTLDEVTGVRAILRRHENGWRIHTAYPEPS